MNQIVLTSQQILIVGFATSALVVLLRIAYEYIQKRKLKWKDEWMQAAVFFTALLLSLLFFPAVLPMLPVFAGVELVDRIESVLKYLNALLAVVASQYGIAHFLYVLLLKNVKDKLGELLVPKLYPGEKG